MPALYQPVLAIPQWLKNLEWQIRFKMNRTNPWRTDVNYYVLKKWNESGFRPPLCTYRLNWARRTSWGWWDDWDDTVLQTQDSKFEPWRSAAEHATSRSRRLPAILTFTRGWGRNIFVSFKPPSPGTEPRTLAWKAAVLTTTLGPPPYYVLLCECEGSLIILTCKVCRYCLSALHGNTTVVLIWCIWREEYPNMFKLINWMA